MLDQSSLSQLKDLKKQIHDSTVRITGDVKGTRKRFGFIINSEDKQEYLLPQTEMERVLPGDTVQCVLEKSQKAEEKPVAKIEKLLNSDFSHFLGKVKEKNKQFYVIPNHPQLNRWVFIPPKYRKNLSDGDLVGAKICQHPFKNKGRVQAEITHIIGKEDDAFIEHRFAIAKWQLPQKEWQNDELEAIRQTAELSLEAELSNSERSDLRDKPFITIDGANTQDIDDALYIEKNEQAYTLYVAIADASTFVEINSPLDKLAQKQMNSIYLPAQKIPMLPDVLSANLCSLKENEDRLALTCILSIDNDGKITHAEYQNAIIKSQGKLNYDDVDAFLSQGSGEFSPVIQDQLKLLNECANKRTNWRLSNAAEMQEYPDYRLILDEQGKMTGIEHHVRNSAQKLVEECMLACNSATANYLAEAGTGLFIGNDGFKPEQLPGIGRILNTHLADFDASQINSLAGFLDFQKTFKAEPRELDLIEVLKKKLKRTQWQSEATPHYGLGFESYTTFSSPIRKYSDLIVHRLIKRLIKGKTLKPLKADLIERLNELSNAVRSAQRDCELSLKCQFLSKHIGETFSSRISMINHRQIGVYWDAYDIHGQIDVRSLKREYSFSQDSLELQCEDLSFKLNQNIEVKLEACDLDNLSLKLSLIGADKPDDSDKEENAGDAEGAA